MRSVYRPSPFGQRPFHWVEAGESEQTVVFLHGIMAHSMAFRCVMESVANRYRIIAPDLPGHGRDRTFESDVVDASLDGLLNWLEGLLETIDDDSVHLVGHSLGATVSFLAALSEERFSAISTLTLVSPGLQIRVPDWLGGVLGSLPARIAALGVNRAGMRLYEPFQWRRLRMTDDEITNYLDPIRKVQRIRYILDVGADLIEQTGDLDRVPDLDHETLLIWGDRDHLLPVTDGHRFSELAPNTRLEVFENCGHCPMEDCPTDFSDVLFEFLDS